MLETKVVTFNADEYTICIRYPGASGATEEYAGLGVYLSKCEFHLRIDGKPGSGCLFDTIVLYPRKMSSQELWNHLCEYFRLVHERQFSARMISTLLASMREVAGSPHFAEIANGSEMMDTIRNILMSRRDVLDYINKPEY